MHILFVTYNHLDTNSGIHIFNVANHLVNKGVHVTVCVPYGKEKSSAVGQPRFETIDFSDIQYERWSNILETNGSVDLIHAWTPREVVRRTVVKLAEQLGCPYIVHMEDNEERLVEANTGRTIAELENLDEQQLDQLIGLGMSYPKQYREFIQHGRGVTALMDKLLEFKPKDMPGLVFWPGYEEDFDWGSSMNPGLRYQLGIGDVECVLVYTGNVHATNAHEVSSLYLAVALLNQRGIPVKLIRTGNDFVPLENSSFTITKKYFINLGFVPRSWMPQIVALADVLVQPGKADAFNEYRFPSKLPEYFASGKPVLLPPTNIGRFLVDGQECILLHEGDALEITLQLEQLLPNKALQQKIGARGQEFAHKNLQWEPSVEKLYHFYEQILLNDA